MPLSRAAPDDISFNAGIAACVKGAKLLRLLSFGMT